jgi:glucose/arabinose dehydrogenase
MRLVARVLRHAVTATVVAAVSAGCAGQSGNGATHRAGGDGPGGAQNATAGPAGGRASARFADVPLSFAAGNAGHGLTAGLRVQLPIGWRAEVWARVSGARLEAWTPQGDLLVSQPASGQVTELVPRGDRAVPPAQHVVISGVTAPQGLAFARLAGHEVLYVAAADAVYRYAWDSGRLGAGRAIVAGLPDTAPAGSDNHMLKNVVAGPGGRIYVDIGSASNASPPGPTDPPRAAVVSFSANGTGMRVIATGVRNGDGLSFAPDGTLWTAVNERDQISYPFRRGYGGGLDAYGQVLQAYVNNHPPDEVARLTPGRDLGWPYCDPDPDVSPGAPATSLRYADLPFTDDQQTNPGGAKLDCATLSPLDRGLPAHSAPLGFHFLEATGLPARWRHGAVIAVHGSWDRQPPRAPAVLWLPWKATAKTLGAPITLVGGFQDSNGDRWGRPVDAVVGPDGALYVSDDQAGAIYRIVP